jgi:hypothetical protein
MAIGTGGIPQLNVSWKNRLVLNIRLSYFLVALFAGSSAGFT